MENYSRAVTPDISPSSLATQSLIPSNSDTPSVACEMCTPEIQLALDNALGDEAERSPGVEFGQPAGEYYSTNFYIMSCH